MRAPCCRRVGGSDGNTEATRSIDCPRRGVTTTPDLSLDTPPEPNIGLRLEDRSDPLTSRCADRDQAADRLASLLLLLCQLLGQLRHDPAAGRGEGVAGGQRRAVDVELGSI